MQDSLTFLLVFFVLIIVLGIHNKLYRIEKRLNKRIDELKKF